VSSGAEPPAAAQPLGRAADRFVRLLALPFLFGGNIMQKTNLIVQEQPVEAVANEAGTKSGGWF